MEDSKEFEAWFTKKFGPRELRGLNVLTSYTDAELLRAAEIGDAAKRILDCRRTWDEKYASALLAWSERK